MPARTGSCLLQLLGRGLSSIATTSPDSQFVEHQNSVGREDVVHGLKPVQDQVTETIGVACADGQYDVILSRHQGTMLDLRDSFQGLPHVLPRVLADLQIDVCRQAWPKSPRIHDGHVSGDHTLATQSINAAIATGT